MPEYTSITIKKESGKAYDNLYIEYRSKNEKVSKIEFFDMLMKKFKESMEAVENANRKDL